MRVSCPNCAAEYEVPSDRLNTRRKVRCARCDSVWAPVQEAETIAQANETVEPPETPADNEPADQPTIGGATAMDRLAAASAPRQSIGLRAAWVASVVLLIGSAAATVTWRGRIVQAWPASALVFGAPSVQLGAKPLPAPGRQTAEAPTHPGNHNN